MSRIKNLTKELESVCNKYGYALKGNTTDGSIMVEKANNVKFVINKVFEKNAFIKSV